MTSAAASANSFLSAVRASGDNCIRASASYSSRDSGELLPSLGGYETRAAAVAAIELAKGSGEPAKSPRFGIGTKGWCAPSFAAARVADSEIRR